MEREQSPRPRSVIGPVILILIGLVLLANSLGLMGWSLWWTLWRLWPVLLIAAGVEIMFGRNHRWGGWVAGGVVIAVIGGALFFAPVVVQEYGTELVQAVAEPLGGAASADVEIAPGIGRLVIRDAKDANMLVEGRIERFQGEQLSLSHSGSNGAARVSIKSQGLKGIPGSVQGRRAWELGLNGSVPMRLDLDLGVGKSELDLTRLRLTELAVNTGVGDTRIEMPATGRFPARIDSGVGKLTVTIPRGMAARIQVSTGIGAIDYDGEFSERGAYRETPDYETAANRIDLRINGGIGAIDIVRR